MKPRHIPTAAVNNYKGRDDEEHSRFISSTHETARKEEEEEEEESYGDDDDGGEYYYEDEAPVWTFRVLYLGSLSSLFLFVINKYFLSQIAQCIMSMVTVLAILYPTGHIMAKFMPKRRVCLRSLGLIEFCLNPGAFDIREYVLISIFANTGAAYGAFTSHSVHTIDPVPS